MYPATADPMKAIDPTRLSSVIHHASLWGDQASQPWHTSNHARLLATRKHTEPMASGLQMC